MRLRNYTNIGGEGNLLNSNSVCYLLSCVMLNGFVVDQVVLRYIIDMIKAFARIPHGPRSAPLFSPLPVSTQEGAIWPWFGIILFYNL